MADEKRPHSETSQPASPFMPMFEKFRDNLDEHHDRRERVIKVSRDITALSKKMIFSLQRTHHLHHPLPAHIQKENRPRQSTIDELFHSIGPDLQGIDAWRYQRQISAGVQEYMEAISFQRYLETQRLISYEEAQQTISGGVVLTEADYVLGLFDLVGELMRFAITGMATTGTLPRGGAPNHSELAGPERDILMDLRELRTSFEAVDTTVGVADGSPLKRDVDKKMEVMKTCVEKVENAVCGLIIRGKERPKGWIPDLGGDERPHESGESY